MLRTIWLTELIVNSKVIKLIFFGVLTKSLRRKGEKAKMYARRFLTSLMFLILGAILIGAAATTVLAANTVYTTTTPQGVVIQDDVTGGQCTLVGSWDPGNKTCTLNSDINIGGNSTSGISIISSGVKLNGNNHTITGYYSSTGVSVNGANDLVGMLNIKNSKIGIEADSGQDIIVGNNITKCETGVVLASNKNSTLFNNIDCGSPGGMTSTIHINGGESGEIILGNNLADSYFGLFADVGSSHNLITQNALLGPTDGGVILLLNSNDNTVVRNYVGGPVGNEGTGNRFNIPAADGGGNYWASNNTCTDNNNDGFCDAPYNWDSHPYAHPYGWDKTPPVIGDVWPTWISTAGATIKTELKDDASDFSGINSASISVYLSGPSNTGPVTTCTTHGPNIDLLLSCPLSGLTAGSYTLTINVQDNAGNAATPVTHTIHVGVPHRYYFPWYDSKNMSSWLLMANPSGAAGELGFGLSVGAGDMDLTPSTLKGSPCPMGQCDAGEVPAGTSITPNFSGLMGGPVTVNAFNGKGIISERSLMGNSFEEVLGTDESRLSGDFYWTWYDEKSPGFANWILVANPPSASADVYYEVKIAGQVMGQSGANPGVIAPGKSVTPTFNGVIGGPVEVLSCSAVFDQYGNCPGTSPGVLTSQRVLSGSGVAFNEVPGIPASELSSDYLWTWYDEYNPGFANWVMVANPSTSSDVYYQVKIAGQIMPTDAQNNPGVIGPTAYVHPHFPGQVGGPVEVSGCSAAFDQYGSCTGTAQSVIATQRVIAGHDITNPSFEEVPGYPVSALTSDYHFSWYDMHSPGSANWVMIANPSASTDVYYQIKIAGQVMPTAPTNPTNPGVISASGRVTPIFPGIIGGPVEITAWSGDPDATKGTPANVMVSQRVLWNGFFNEVLGTVIK